MNKIWILLVCCFPGIIRCQKEIQWTAIQPGIWKATIGSKSFVSILALMQNVPQRAALQRMPLNFFPLPKDEIVARVNQNEIDLRFPLWKNETISGLGLNFQSVNQRGKILTLHVDHFGGSDNGRTHAPVPFYISSRGYGVLIDAAEYITVYAGTAVRKDSKSLPSAKDRNTDTTWEDQPYSDAMEFKVPGQGVDVYVFAGPTPMEVVQRYNLLNGGGCLPPKWGLGFTQRLPTKSTAQDLVNEADNYTQHDFPLDFIGLEPGWQSRAYPCTLEWDSTRFPDPAAFNKALADRKVRSNVWFNPYISPAGSLYEKIKPLSGSHLVWNGLVPDITMPQTRAILREHFRKYIIGAGVSGFKIDEVDGYDNWLWPDVASFPSGFTGTQMRQVFGLLMQKMTLEWFHELNQRTYGLVRASNTGASPMPYVLYDDYYNHRDFVTALISSGNIGVLWTPEVRKSDSAEEWIRRIQTACFSPMAMINAWADGTKPWSFPAVEEAVRASAMLRTQLLPYLYSVFAAYHFEGKPPFRGMNLEKGKLLNKDILDEYMMGDDMLIAPLFAGEKKRKVILPAGNWFDFYTGAGVGGDQEIEVTAGLDRIPVFVRDGAIIPMIAPQRQIPAPDEILPLHARYYGSAPGHFFLYDDDGETFNYEKNQYSFTLLTVMKDSKGRLKGNQPVPPTGKPYHYTPGVSWEFMSK